MKYKLKDDIQVDFTNKRKIAKEIGIHESSLSRILHKKVKCSKAVAHYIVELNCDRRVSDSDLEKYFYKVR